MIWFHDKFRDEFINKQKLKRNQIWQHFRRCWLFYENKSLYIDDQND